LRKDPVSGAWVVIAPEQEAGVKLERPELPETSKSDCPFCPGHEDGWGPEILSFQPVGADPATSKWGVRVFPNRVPILRTDIVYDRHTEGLFDRIAGVGANEIVVESPEHKLALKDFSAEQLTLVLKAWRERLVDLFRDIRLKYVSIVKNQGRRAGARISHPHSQIIATPTVPIGIRDELDSARSYFDTYERNLFADLLASEEEEGSRIVSRSHGFVAFCPFASRNPFEVWILPKRRVCHFGYETDDTLSDLAGVLLRVCKAIAESLYDPDLNVVLKSGPNPHSGRRQWLTLDEDFVWRVELVPRILRPSGYENATGMRVNPTSPEDAALSLRESLQRIEKKGSNA
jgi:UDPglucose--hexose-1-phosphate uridylyltransferase